MVDKGDFFAVVWFYCYGYGYGYGYVNTFNCEENFLSPLRYLGYGYGYVQTAEKVMVTGDPNTTQVPEIL